MTEEENKTEKPAPAQMPNLGKFQNVEALMRAYQELEAEFTRRSQRLKALEAAALSAADGKTDKNADGTAAKECARASWGNTSRRSRACPFWRVRARGSPRPPRGRLPSGRPGRLRSAISNIKNMEDKLWLRQLRRTAF